MALLASLASLAAKDAELLHAALFLLGVALLCPGARAQGGDASSMATTAQTSPEFTVRVTTSTETFAGTNSTVYITFFGDRGVSDRFELFAESGGGRGAQEKVQLYSSRDIGVLQKIKLQNAGTDGWVVSDIMVTQGDTDFFFDIQPTLLDTPDIALNDETVEQYEPPAPLFVVGAEVAEFPVQRTLSTRFLY